MKYIPEWLRYYLMRFEWYQRRCPVLTISDVTNEALKVLEDNFAFTAKVNRILPK